MNFTDFDGLRFVKRLCEVYDKQTTNAEPMVVNIQRRNTNGTFKENYSSGDRDALRC